MAHFLTKDCLLVTVNFYVPMLKRKKNKLSFLVNWYKFGRSCTTISFPIPFVWGEHKCNWKRRP